MSYVMSHGYYVLPLRGRATVYLPVYDEHGEVQELLSRRTFPTMKEALAWCELHPWCDPEGDDMPSEASH